MRGKIDDAEAFVSANEAELRRLRSFAGGGEGDEPMIENALVRSAVVAAAFLLYGCGSVQPARDTGDGSGGAAAGAGGDAAISSAGVSGAGGVAGMAGDAGAAGAGSGGGAGHGGSGVGAEGGAVANSGAAGALAPPSITATSFAVVAHGVDLTITGARLRGATAVTIGGTEHVPAIASDTQLNVRVLDTTPIGPQSIVVTGTSGSSAPFAVTVIHLVINEVDPDQSNVDAAEFVEIATGVAGVSLAGYSLVLWNGSSDTAYVALDLNVTTNADGLLIAGNASLTTTLSFPDNTLQNGADAVAVYAAPASVFPTGTLVTATHVIDAVVYGSGDADDVALLDTLFGPIGTTGRVQIDESANTTPTTDSIQRCGSSRLRGDRFVLAAPSANAANTVTACN